MLMGIDLCILRHSESVIHDLAKKFSSMQFINAGEGSVAHPSQALIDLMTIRESKESFKDLKITNMILVSRSKKKIIGLDGYGIKITKQEIIK